MSPEARRDAYSEVSRAVVLSAVTWKAGMDRVTELPGGVGASFTAARMASKVMIGERMHLKTATRISISNNSWVSLAGGGGTRARHLNKTNPDPGDESLRWGTMGDKIYDRYLLECGSGSAAPNGPRNVVPTRCGDIDAVAREGEDIPGVRDHA